MKNKSVWMDKMQAKIDEWQAKLDETKAKAEQKSAEVREDVEDKDFETKMENFFYDLDKKWKEFWD